MTMELETWTRLNILWERMLRLSDDALRATRQQDADNFWHCVDQQRAIVREALTIKTAQEARAARRR